MRVVPQRWLSTEKLTLWSVVLKKTLEIPLECKEIKPVNPKGNQSWIFIGRTDAEAETPILWPPDVKNWLTGEDPDARKDWRQEDKGTTEDEMAGWHHWLDKTCWASSRSWWWTEKPGVLQTMESQNVGGEWATELNQTWYYPFPGNRLLDSCDIPKVSTKIDWTYTSSGNLKIKISWNQSQQ